MVLQALESRLTTPAPGDQAVEDDRLIVQLGNGELAPLTTLFSLYELLVQPQRTHPLLHSTVVHDQLLGVVGEGQGEPHPGAGQGFATLLHSIEFLRRLQPLFSL